MALQNSPNPNRRRKRRRNCREQAGHVTPLTLNKRRRWRGTATGDRRLRSSPTPGRTDRPFDALGHLRRTERSEIRAEFLVRFVLLLRRISRCLSKPHTRKQYHTDTLNREVKRPLCACAARHKERNRRQKTQVTHPRMRYWGPGALTSSLRNFLKIITIHFLFRTFYSRFSSYSLIRKLP